MHGENSKSELHLRFVLFEGIPLMDHQNNLDCLKLKPSLKDEIDEIFAKRYRLNVDVSSSKKTSFQEEFNVRTGNWQASVTNEQHILRFLMQWLLVAAPQARQHALDLYGPLLRDRCVPMLLQSSLELSLILHRSCLELAKQAFESSGTWDDQWSKFGQPAIRFSVRVASEHCE